LISRWVGEVSPRGLLRDYREKQEKHLQEFDYKDIFETIGFPVLIIRRDMVIQRVNAAFEEFMQCKREDVEARKSLGDFLAGNDREQLQLYIDRRLQNREPVASGYESLLRDEAGKVRCVVLSLTRMAGAETIIVSIVDVTERKAEEESIRQMAYRDALTGLPNRVLFNDRLNLALAHARRHDQRLVVMLLDLDRFKDVNDSFGHRMGDQLLHAVGARLAGTLRQSDTIARMGGDEFMLLLPEIKRIEDGCKIAQKILNAFQDSFSVGGHEINVTTSIGVAVYPHNGTDADTLVKNADIAMYRAKERGRNNYQCYTPAMNQIRLPFMHVRRSGE